MKTLITLLLWAILLVLCWPVALINLLLLGGQIEDRTKGIQMMLSGAIFFMAFGIPAIFNMRISRTEYTLREQLLKIELKIAELSEKTGHER